MTCADLILGRGESSLFWVKAVKSSLLLELISYSPKDNTALILLLRKLHSLLPSSLPLILGIEKPLMLGWSPRSHVTKNQSLFYLLIYFYFYILLDRVLFKEM